MYLYDGILLGNKKEKTTTTWIHLINIIKIKQKTISTKTLLLHYILEMAKLIYSARNENHNGRDNQNQPQKNILGDVYMGAYDCHNSLNNFLTICACLWYKLYQKRYKISKWKLLKLYFILYSSIKCVQKNIHLN